MITNKKVALVLGGTIPHIALIENLKSRGYYTILVDYYENPPAKKYADEHIQESTLDQEKVLQVAKEKNADLVISTSIDQANVTACYVGQKLDLPIPYSYESALTFTNKVLMKEILIKNNIPTSNFIEVDSLENINTNALSLPFVVKPSDSTGSKGVYKVNNENELKNAVLNALEIARNKRVIIEEFKKGTEIQADFLVNDRIPYLIMTRDKIKDRNHSDEFVLQSLGSLVPAQISKTVIEKIKIIAKQISVSFELVNTALFIQAIVDNEDVNVIEFACRTGGGLSFSMIKEIVNFDFLNSTVDTYLGINTSIELKDINSFYRTYLIYTQGGVFQKIEGLKELQEEGYIEKYYCFKNKGTIVGSKMTSNDRVGAILLKADTKEILDYKLSKALNGIKVLNMDNKDILYKQTYNMISESSLIKNSTMGSNPKIYKNVEIKNSKLLDNCIIGDNTIVIDSELDSNISINRSNYILRSKIGSFTYTGMGTSIRSTQVGKFCSLAWNVSIGGGNHEFQHVTTSPLWRFLMLNENVEHKKNIHLISRYKEFGGCTIGNDVWLATNSVILRNVKVGNGAIIGAGAVVTKDVEPYSIVAGVPAKKIKMRFDDKTIEALEEIQWWNWPVDIIRKNQDLIYSSQVDQDVIQKLKEIAHQNNL